MAKDKKTRYQELREECGYTREKVCELMGGFSHSKLVRIESGDQKPHPKDVYDLSRIYKTPSLCNYYCSHECDIGEKYVPEIRVKDLSQIVLEMLASLNTTEKKRERLIEICSDGVISKDEIRDFIDIQESLEKISITVETLQIWCERMRERGVIDKVAYEYELEQRKKRS